MKTDLHHLPDKQQAELAHIRTTLLTEFEAAKNGGGGGTQPWRRGGYVQKIILFGSYARDDWVDEPDNGYLSDYDLLVVVSHEQLTDIARYWWAAEDKILNDPSIGRTVNLIVHDLAGVNQALGRGEYFWTDIVRDGVALYDVPGHPFAAPIPMTASNASDAAERHFASKMADLDLWIRDAEAHIAMQGEGKHVRKRAAFELHQAVETAYACALLVHTFYFPRSHNIKFLRSLAEDIDKRLIAAWPRENRIDRRRFEQLKRAYVEARYSDQYDVSLEDLSALTEAATQLRDLVAKVCQEQLETLRIKARQA